VAGVARRNAEEDAADDNDMESVAKANMAVAATAGVMMPATRSLQLLE
jgi:hypothetical protein